MSFLSQPITAIFTKSSRQIGNIAVNVLITESATDALEITQQPVQQGANIADHAFMKPGMFSMQMLFADNLTTSLSKIYQNLLTLQSSRVPFDVITPKRTYKNMLFLVLGQTTDKKTENCLAINASFEQVNIVSVSTTTVPRANQRSPQKTAATQPAGQKSALLSLKEGVGGLFQVK